MWLNMPHEQTNFHDPLRFPNLTLVTFTFHLPHLHLHMHGFLSLSIFVSYLIRRFREASVIE